MGPIFRRPPLSLCSFQNIACDVRASRSTRTLVTLSATFHGQTRCTKGEVGSQSVVTQAFQTFSCSAKGRQAPVRDRTEPKKTTDPRESVWASLFTMGQEAYWTLPRQSAGTSAVYSPPCSCTRVSSARHVELDDGGTRISPEFQEVSCVFFKLSLVRFRPPSLSTHRNFVTCRLPPSCGSLFG